MLPPPPPLLPPPTSSSSPFATIHTPRRRCHPHDARRPRPRHSPRQEAYRCRRPRWSCRRRQSLEVVCRAGTGDAAGSQTRVPLPQHLHEERKYLTTRREGRHVRAGSDSVIGQSEHKARIPSPQHEGPANGRTPPPAPSQSAGAGKARASHATGEKRNEMSVSDEHFLADPRY